MTNGIAAVMDMRRQFLHNLKVKSPKFHGEFVMHFLTNKQSLAGIETDFLRALSHVKNIGVFARLNGDVSVEDPNGNVCDFDSYEDALVYVVELIKECTPAEQLNTLAGDMKVFATEIHAVGEDGNVRVYEGKPVMASSLEKAKETCKKYMPYQRVIEQETEMSKRVEKALK